MAKQYGRQIVVILPDTGLPEISKPRIDFDIQMTADGEQNWANISIFGLERDNHRRIEERGERIRIDAGYRSAGQPSKIFEGAIQRIDKDRSENSFVTRIEASDIVKSNKVKGGHIDATFKGDVSARVIARKIVEGMKSPDGSLAAKIGSLEAIPASAKVKDFRAEGVPGEQLNRLLSSIEGDVRWYVDGLSIVRFDVGYLPRADAAHLVKTPTTGLIAVPSKEENGRTSAQMLLDPRVELGSGFRIDDSEYVSAVDLKVVGIEHSGTNWRGQFKSILDMLPHDFKDEE